jgi:hypothetical protein
MLILIHKVGPVQWQFSKDRFPAGWNYVPNHVLPQLHGFRGPHLVSQTYDVLANNALIFNPVEENTIDGGISVTSVVCLSRYVRNL